MRLTKLMAAVLLAFPLAAAAECTLQWDYDDEASSWIEGFRIYQAGNQVGLAGRSDREGLCADLGLTPGPEAITATAYRQDVESPHSDSASFVLSAPGLRVEITTP